MTISTVTTETLKDFISGQGYGVAPSAVVAICEQLLAVREAQPVAYRYRYNGKHLASAGCGDMVSSWKYCEEVDLVNPDERYEHQALFTAPPAPALPPIMKGITPYCQDWNACRAAMLIGGKS
ncbi:hypothetical protein [Serratia fonticola]|uniref:hypothetical protein n=1 Tax=Serratia fonticola TaxID=47917 RepID=UPI0034C5FBE1